MIYSTGQLWLMIALLGIGTFLIRFSFLGLIGGRKLPDWLLRHLRYAPMAVIPALLAPMILWPAATDGVPDPARLIATAVTLTAGILSRNTLIAILFGASALALGLIFLG